MPSAPCCAGTSSAGRRWRRPPTFARSDEGARAAR
jgi:hypothetical protein